MTKLVQCLSFFHRISSPSSLSAARRALTASVRVSPVAVQGCPPAQMAQQQSQQIAGGVGVVAQQRCDDAIPIVAGARSDLVCAQCGHVSVRSGPCIAKSRVDPGAFLAAGYTPASSSLALCASLCAFLPLLVAELVRCDAFDLGEVTLPSRRLSARMGCVMQRCCRVGRIRSCSRIAAGCSAGAQA